MSCSLPGCDIKECDAIIGDYLRHEAWLRYTSTLRDFYSRLLPKALGPEWGRVDFDEAWERLQHWKPDMENPVDLIVFILAISSPHAFPEGWTPRRQKQKECYQAVIRMIRSARALGLPLLAEPTAKDALA